ncbi:hypothetical protein HN51_051774 [Arachis hypogaea]
MSSACAIPLSAIPLPARNPPLSFFSLLSTLSPASSLWLTSLTAGLAVDPSLSGFTLLSRPFQTQAHRSLSPPSQALSRSVTIASSSSCVGRQRFLRRELVLGRNWEDEIELDGEVIELSYRGLYPCWQLLRGSVERSPARASLLYLPLFLVFTAMAFILFTEENVDIAVVEAGLGGARDAKNVISSVRIKAAPHTPLRLRDDPETGSILEKLTEENLRDWGLLQDFYRFVKVMVVDAEAYTYDDEVIKKVEAMGKPENPEEES